MRCLFGFNMEYKKNIFRGTGKTDLAIVSVNITEVCSVLGDTGLYVFSITQ